MRRMLGALKDFVFPAACPLCRRDQSSDVLCRDCHRLLPRLAEEESRSETDGMTVWSLLAYRDPVRECLFRLKYGGDSHPAFGLGTLLFEELLPRLRSVGADCVIPMPLGRRRRRERGYNQAELLARRLAFGLGLPLSSRLLVRTRESPPQASLSGSERWGNVAGAFRGGDLVGRCALLVDDVVTTGSTLRAAAEALRAGGARRVVGVALCRADLRSGA